MVDYSKWKDIEISDDEDETHPNIDTPSLFRWRHQARLERMEERRKEQEAFQKRKNDNQKKIGEIQKKIVELEKDGATNQTKLTELRNEVKRLEAEHDAIKKEEDEIQKKEKLTPWNVDTISQPGFAKTVINTKKSRPKDEDLSEEEREARMKKFIKENEKQLKHFGMLRRYDDSKAYLKEHSHLVCEDSANYLVIWCINLEMEDKHDLMHHVAHQIICLQYILELAKQLDYDPRGCVDSFFSRIQVAEPVYKQSFDDELAQFKERIRKRAAEKLEKAVKEVEEEERQKRLGPGGLDPIEVFETLPEELQKCFQSQDVQLLQDTLAKMDVQEAKVHMKRCVDSGLWVPNANGKDDENDNEGTSGGIAEGGDANAPTTSTAK